MRRSALCSRLCSRCNKSRPESRLGKARPDPGSVPAAQDWTCSPASAPAPACPCKAPPPRTRCSQPSRGPRDDPGRTSRTAAACPGGSRRPPAAWSRRRPRARADWADWAGSSSPPFCLCANRARQQRYPDGMTHPETGQWHLARNGLDGGAGRQQTHLCKCVEGRVSYAWWLTERRYAGSGASVETEVDRVRLGAKCTLVGLATLPAGAIPGEFLCAGVSRGGSGTRSSARQNQQHRNQHTATPRCF